MAVEFEKPEELDGLFYIRDIRFIKEKQEINYIVSPTDKDARQQELTISVFNDPSVDKGALTKLLSNKDDVVRLFLVREEGNDHCFAYHGTSVQKDNKVMDVDGDGRKRHAFTWTKNLDDHVDKWHGFTTKAQAIEMMSGMVADDHAQGSIANRAKQEALLLAKELNPSLSDAEVPTWVEKNLRPVAHTSEILHRGVRGEDGREQPMYFNADYNFTEQCDWNKATAAQRQDLYSAYVWQKALQEEIVQGMSAPVVHDGKEISPHLAREKTLVENGLLYAPNPTLTDELRDIKGREMAEREAGKAVRSGVAFLGGVSASPEFDDIRPDEKETGKDGICRHATIGGEILAAAGTGEEYVNAKNQLARGDRDNGTKEMMSVLSNTAGAYCGHEASKVIYGKNHGIIAEQDEHGAVEAGFSRRHVDVEAEKEKAAKLAKERQTRLADIAHQGIDGLVGDGSPTHGFVK